jgi:hypothetical protein
MEKVKILPTLAIKGHTTRGKEIIEILEMLGGDNLYNKKGDNEIFCYYILTFTSIFVNKKPFFEFAKS